MFTLRPENHNTKFLTYIALYRGFIDTGKIDKATFNELLHKTHNFNNFKESMDSYEILNFILEVKILLCEIVNYKDGNFVKAQFRLIFPSSER